MGPNFDIDGSLTPRLLDMGAGFVMVGSMCFRASRNLDLVSNNKLDHKNQVITFVNP